MAVIKGSDFMISIIVDGTPKDICFSTDCAINQSFETREISGQQGQWRDYIGGFSGYDISVPGLINWQSEMNYLELEALAHARTKFQWSATDFVNGGVVHSGTILTTQLNLTSVNKDVVRFDFAAIGCGPKITQILPITSTVFLADFSGNRLVGCPDPYPVALYWYDFTFIGIANNADEVIEQYNSYIGNLYYMVTGYTTGCDFNLISSYNAPFIPLYIYAEQTPALAMWTGTGDEAISNDQENDNAISPGYA
jgi:hypothetical protein